MEEFREKSFTPSINELAGDRSVIESSLEIEKAALEIAAYFVGSKIYVYLVKNQVFLYYKG